MTIGGVEVYADGKTLRWTSGMAIDADGSPRCYAPTGSAVRGLDLLANAGHSGNWYGIACDDDGVPFVQDRHDPCPGYYVSTTALCDLSKARRDPARYVDSEQVPFIAVPPELLAAGARKGDLVVVSHGPLRCGAIVADVGPRGRIGEGSIALATALGINPDPRRGGVSALVSYVIYLGSATQPPWPRVDVARVALQLERDLALIG